MDMNYNGIKVQKPANSNDGQEGGLQAIRDTTNLAGSYNKINCVNHAYTIVGKNVNGFEWNLYAQMDNYADTDPAQRREHVAFYSKANKFGTATNWAACLEVHDTNGHGACVGAEVDIWTKGEDNGSRIGLDVMMAGGNDVVDKLQAVGATAALRSSSPDSNPLAYWSFGAMLRGIKLAGVQITSIISGGIRGIELLGKWAVGIDTSQAKCNTAIRLAEGQVIAFEGTDQLTLSWTQHRFAFKAAGKPVFEIDSWNGDVYKMGKKVL